MKFHNFIPPSISKVYLIILEVPNSVFSFIENLILFVNRWFLLLYFNLFENEFLIIIYHILIVFVIIRTQIYSNFRLYLILNR